ncbi:TetR/AcrR family transcriptional regulator [Diaminobutyricibacter tongyongensis]|uniref:TetR/AcrR family transcriptional regulator n=2 Tax=Leifsonia tongyongensis TaxID=1268043 RepID=A0A6L9XXV2_9MICO|nr:TetR/AcrR family transcriptional regulator [Diaminobutyricibacter tongyongensis]
MPSNHERILSAAYELFTRHSVHELTLAHVQEAADVTEAELAQEFGSVDALAEECLKRRERDWTIGIVRAGARARAEHPEGRLLAIFDVFDEWFHRDDYEACTFINVLLEMGRDHSLGRASMEHLAYIRSLVADLAREAGLRDPEEFAFSWHILMKGAIINAVEGDDKAALRAQAMGRDLIRRHRAVSTDTGSYQLDPRWALG